jgi:hypothetical protein
MTVLGLLLLGLALWLATYDSDPEDGGLHQSLGFFVCPELSAFPPLFTHANWPGET